MMELLEGRQLLDGVPEITSADTASSIVGNNFSFLVTTIGVEPVKLKEVGALPSGLNFKDNGNGTASITGVPHGAGKNGVFDFTINATNSLSFATQPFTLDVAQKAHFTSVPHTVFNTVAGGSYTIKTAGGFPTPTMSVSGLPTGASFTDNGDGTATLTVPPGSVVTPDFYDDSRHNALTIIASTPAGDVTQDFSLTVDQAPTFTSASSETIDINRASTFMVTATGFPDVRLALQGTLPPGMHFSSMNSGTLAGIGTLTGTPTQSGSFKLTFLAANLEVIGAPVQQVFTLNVDQPPQFTTLPSAKFSVGRAATFSIKTVGFPPGALTKSGALPAGLTYTDNGDGTGKISGTPAAGTGGIYHLTISAAGGGTQNFALTVLQPAAITSAASASFTIGSPGTFIVTSTGFPTDVLTESGKLPTGLSFVDQGSGTALLSGTAGVGTSGSYKITITAKNSGATVTQKFTLTIS
jgi:hypothetical protein